MQIQKTTSSPSAPPPSRILARALSDRGSPSQKYFKRQTMLPLLSSPRATFRTLNREIEGAVRESGAEAFVAAEQPLQVAVCGLLGALQGLDGAASTGEIGMRGVLAIGLWSALSFQPPRTEPKLEVLRGEVLKKAHRHVIEMANGSRQRVKVPDAVTKETEPAKIAEFVTTVLNPAVNALRINAALDREEIDLLWWALGDWSELLKRRYSASPDSVATALASGIEAGQMLRCMPGDLRFLLSKYNLKRCFGRPSMGYWRRRATMAPSFPQVPSWLGNRGTPSTGTTSRLANRCGNASS